MGWRIDLRHPSRANACHCFHYGKLFWIFFADMWYRLYHISSKKVTPPKTNMEPENKPLEEEIPLANHHFQGFQPIVFGWVPQNLPSARKPLGHPRFFTPEFPTKKWQLLSPQNHGHLGCSFLLNLFQLLGVSVVGTAEVGTLGRPWAKRPI